MNSNTITRFKYIERPLIINPNSANNNKYYHIYLINLKFPNQCFHFFLQNTRWKVGRIAPSNYSVLQSPLGLSGGQKIEIEIEIEEEKKIKRRVSVVVLCDVDT